MAKKVELPYNFYYLLLFRAVSDFVKGNDPNRKVELIARQMFDSKMYRMFAVRCTDPSNYPPKPVLDTATYSGMMAYQMELAAYCHLGFANKLYLSVGVAPISINPSPISGCGPQMCLRQAMYAKYEMSRALKAIKSLVERDKKKVTSSQIELFEEK